MYQIKVFDVENQVWRILATKLETYKEAKHWQKVITRWGGTATIVYA